MMVIVAAKRLGVFDPSGRLIDDLAHAADRASCELVPVEAADATDGFAALLVAPAVAGDLGPIPDGGAPRWIIGEAPNAARVAGAAASAAASGVLLTPVSHEALTAIVAAEPTSADFDLARARGLIATSLVDLTGAAQETLRSVADGFTGHDCIVWWKDGAQMTPTSARPSPTETYRAQIEIGRASCRERVETSEVAVASQQRSS